jgi:hypothetical protein
MKHTVTTNVFIKIIKKTTDDHTGIIIVSPSTIMFAKRTPTNNIINNVKDII